MRRGDASGLLERDAELARVQDLLGAALAGRGGALLVEGSAGIGKSVVLEAASAAARERGMRVLAASGGELETAFGFGVVRQLLEGLVASADGAAAGRLLDGAAQLAAPVVTPPRDGHIAPVAAPVDAFAVQHGLYWLLANLADEGPVALIVDDLHWADAASTRWLVYLCRRISAMPIAVLAAVRLGDQGARDPLLVALRQEPLVNAVRLGPLSEDAVGALARNGVGALDPSLARACHEASGGNPFLLSELLTALVESGAGPDAAAQVESIAAPGITRSLLRRLARLGPDAVALAGAVAVLGSGAQLRTVAALAGLSTDAARVAADGLADAHILTPGGPPAFLHPLLRAAVYDDLPPAQRAGAHRRGADLLAEHGAAPERVAGQLLLAEPSGDPWVAAMLGEAARGALARGARDEAGAYLRRSLAEPPPAGQRPAVLRGLGTVEFLAGDLRGLDHLRAALAATDDPRARAPIAVELSALLVLAGRAGEAVTILQDALERLDPHDDHAAGVVAVLAGAAEFDTSTAALVDAIAVDRPAGRTADARLLLATLAYRDARAGVPADTVAALAGRALATGQFVAEQPRDMMQFIYVVQALLLADRFDGAAATVEQLFTRARARGSLLGFGHASWLRGCLHHRRGALDEAAADLRSALRAAHEGGWRAAVPCNLGVLLAILVAQGDVDGAQAELDAAALHERADLGTTTAYPLFLLEGRGLLRLAQGRDEEGLDDLLELGRRCATWGDVNPAQFAWRSAAAGALLRLNRTPEAAALAQEELDLARRFGAPRAIAVALRGRALTAPGDEALALLREAAAVIASSPAGLVRAEVLVDLGAALRRANQRAESREPLIEGHALAVACRAAPLAARAADELAVAGSRPRSVLRSGVDELTASELRVCRLAADGLSNPEIAQALFVTRATVESHLHSAYRKLGVTSRRQLAPVVGAA